MAAKAGPLFALFAKGRLDWTQGLKDSETHVVVEAQGKAYVLDVMNESFKNSLLESFEERWIYLAQILREDEEILFAFADPRERSLFEELRNIDGVGPKSAALLVGRTGLEGFKAFLEDPKKLSSVKISGIGAKGLEKISLGIKQKNDRYRDILLEIPSGAPSHLSLPSDTFGLRPELEKALTQLGLKSFEIRHLYQQMCLDNEEYKNMPLQQLLQESLKYWGRKRSNSELQT